MKDSIKLKMNFKNYAFVVFMVLLASCDGNPRLPVTLTKYKFMISGEAKGTITQVEGTARLECRENRRLLYFEEADDHKTSQSDDLIGELILAFRNDDSTGTYILDAISASKRKDNGVGIVVFLDQLEFDDLAAQYISNTKRYEEVTEGSLLISKWSTQVGGVIQGELDIELMGDDRKVNIKGAFSVKLDETNTDCP